MLLAGCMLWDVSEAKSGIDKNGHKTETNPYATSISRDEFPYCLLRSVKDNDYVLAEIAMEGQQGEIGWTYGESATSLVEKYKDAKENQLMREDKERADHWLFLKIKTDGMHNLDIWQGVRKEWGESVSALMPAKGFCQLDEGSGYGKRIAYIKDGFFYVLECVDNQSGSDAEVIRCFNDACIMANSFHLIVWMYDESFYWSDYKDRTLHMQEPERSFYQVAGEDETHNGKPCGFLQKAEYVLALSDDTPEVKISFTLEEPLENLHISSFSAAEYPFRMEISDAKTNKLLYTDTVPLCVDVIDTISFNDSDGDGYLEMKIAYPDNTFVRDLEYLYLGREFRREGFDPLCEYYVDDSPNCWFEDTLFCDIKEYPLHQIFQKKEEDQQEDIHRRQDVVIVQKGDTLWRLAEKYLGDGRSCRKLYMDNRDVIGEDSNYLQPGMELRIFK